MSHGDLDLESPTARSSQQLEALVEVSVMKTMLAITVLTLATLAWATQQPGGTPQQSGGQAGSQGQAPNVPVTEGCLGGSNPNFTITDKAGTTYKLNIPPSADTSKLAPHVGESVQVAGNVKDTGMAGHASIDVQGIGRGTGQCPANGSKGTQAPPKQ